jgi:ATP:ADP antiporter, AAA family
VSSRRNELVLTAWGAITFGALLTSYSALRPVRDAVVLDGDPDRLPWLFTATLIVVGLAAPLWSALVGRVRSRGELVTRTFHVFAACAIGFSILVATGVGTLTVGRVFYVWSAVFNLFVVSVFWSLLADLLGPDVARRLYGPIAAGGTVGTVLGPMLTVALVNRVGVAGMLVVSALLLELAVFGVAKVERAGAAIEVEHRERTVVADEGPLASMRHVARSPYLLAIVGYVLCTAIAATLVYMQQANITKAWIPDRTARTEFFASVDLIVALVTFGAQTLLAARAIRWFGPGIVLAVLPLAQLAGLSVLAVAPTLMNVALVQIVSRSATHGLTRPSRELLFTVVSRDDKYRAKNVIDTMIYRAGDFGSSWLYRGLTAIGVAGLATAPLVVGWLALAAFLGIGFRRRTHQETS